MPCSTVQGENLSYLLTVLVLSVLLAFLFLCRRLVSPSSVECFVSIRKQRHFVPRVQERADGEDAALFYVYNSCNKPRTQLQYYIGRGLEQVLLEQHVAGRDEAASHHNEGTGRHVTLFA